MYQVYQYQHGGRIKFCGYASDEVQAVEACVLLEQEWHQEGNQLYGATFITSNGKVVGGPDGIHEVDDSPPYDASGSILTGREW